MNTKAIEWTNLITDFPVKKGIRKASIHSILKLMADFTDMNTNEFYLSREKIMAITFLSKTVVDKTRKWIEEIGLIKATNRKRGGSNQIRVYKFTYEIKMSTVAALESSLHDNSKISPLQNINSNKKPAPKQQNWLPQNRDSSLSQNRDSLKSLNRGTKEEPKNIKKTSYEKEPLKSTPIIQEQNKKDEGEEVGFLLIKKILKTCNKTELMRLLGKKHSVHSINCYHLELQNDIKSGKARSIGALLSRLENGSEWICKPPMIMTTGGNKPTQQTRISLVTAYESQEIARENNKKSNDKESCGNASEQYLQMIANG